ncbi:MAG: class I SAM-dependent methyltransferase [Elusimicrobiota bacterium]
MYKKDLVFIHSVGFGGFARRCVPVLIARLRGAGARRGARVVELGCGAGAATSLLLRAGYDVFGLDASAEFVRLARRKAPKARFVVGRLPNAALPACDAVVAVGEVLNYMSRRADFDFLFRRIFAALRPGGVFLFDAKRPGRAVETLTRGKAGKDWAVLATSSEKRDGTLTREITSFRRVGSTYRRSDETHRLTLLSSRDLSRRLRRAGFSVRAEPLSLSREHFLIEARRR